MTPNFSNLFFPLIQKRVILGSDRPEPEPCQGGGRRAILEYRSMVKLRSSNGNRDPHRSLLRSVVSGFTSCTRNADTKYATAGLVYLCPQTCVARSARQSSFLNKRRIISSRLVVCTPPKSPSYSSPIITKDLPVSRRRRVPIVVRVREDLDS